MGYVLITGASGGIGFELAKIFAEKGKNIIVVSSNGEKLMSAVEKLKETASSDIRYYIMDLSKKTSAEELYKQVTGDMLEVDILVNNAGVGMVGEFLSLDTLKEEAMLTLNIFSLVSLTRMFAQRMTSGGKILNISSTGAFQAGPYISTYYASKAFVGSFSDAIRAEFLKKGIAVSTLYPGATKTDFSKRAGKRDASNSMSPEKVALSAYKGLMKNKRRIIPGAVNVLMLSIPETIRVRIIGKVQKSLWRERK